MCDRFPSMTNRLGVASLLAMCLLTTDLAAQQGAPDLSRAGNKQVEKIMETYGGRGVMSDGSDPTPAEECVEQFEMRKGLAMQLVASEPDVSQPLFLSWDSRGRMWCAQYRQYQFPAGLKVIRYDQHLRAVFDKVPDPPPHGTKGVDKITVHTDTDGDGIYDTSKDVLTELNIASSVAVGRGGIWVLNPPYLLFYPDANRDDVPDGDPEVHLTGFGIQDTHSVSNNLIWGPDGWLYAVNGSTTAGDVSSAVSKGVRFQGQCVWRYHPESKEFEIYAEGGGNTFSLDIDAAGRVFCGTNGGKTRGWYFPQGSYSNKNWGKHGPLTNPYAFGFFSAMKFEGDGRRFPQAFCIYEGGLLDKEYAGTIIAPNALHNLVWNSSRIPDGSTYRTVDQDNVAVSPDRWFRPVYSGVGPDGAVYMADWYDTRLSHVSPIDDWHKESGRVYRVVPTDKPNAKYTEGDLHQLSNEMLISKFRHPNKWVRRRAMLELGWRGDKSIAQQLIQHVNNEGSLESLWALNLIGELSADLSGKWLQHDSADIRRWVVRLLGDQHQSHPGLSALAGRESNVQVRSQLAATAKRIDANNAVAIIKALLVHEDDHDDPHMPLMIWWALEAHAEDWSAIESMLSEQEVWGKKIFAKHLASRLMQRYAAASKPEDLQRCAKLFTLAPDDQSAEQLILGLNRAFQGQSVPPLPKLLADALRAHQQKTGDSGLVLSLRQGDKKAVDEAIKLLKNNSADLNLRLAVATVLGEVNHPSSVKTLLRLAGGSTNEPALQRLCIRSLAQYDDDSIATTLVKAFGSRISAEHGLRATACRTLAGRPKWSQVLLAEINAWRIRPADIPADVVQQLRSYEQPEIVTAVEKAFGKSIARSGPESIAAMNRLKDIVTSAAGNSKAGKVHFDKRCGVCHQLFGEGKKIGPPLDGYERGSVSFWLNAIVEPNLEIREGFQSYLALMDDGRTITGMIAAQDLKTVTLRNADNQLVVVARNEITKLKVLPTSLMPNDVLKDMTDRQVRDLFAYLSLGAKK